MLLTNAPYFAIHTSFAIDSGLPLCIKKGGTYDDLTRRMLEIGTPSFLGSTLYALG
jgi:hypothetical protein